MGRFVVSTTTLLVLITGCATFESDSLIDYRGANGAYAWIPPIRSDASAPQLTKVVPVSAARVKKRPRRSPPVARQAKTHRDASWFPRSCPISKRWTTIVIHHSATDRGGAKAFDEYHRRKNGWDELGYHFVIGNGTDTPDGRVEVGPRWHAQKHGAHCKTSGNYFNEHGIGICLVGDFTKTRPSPQQMTSLERLLRFLTNQCRIPISRVTTHRDVTHRTRCPGRYFPMQALRRSLARPVTANSLP